MQPILGQRYQVVIVDWANFIARAFSIRGETEAAFAELFLEMVFKLKKSFRNFELVFALEGAGTERRRKLWPEYKRGSRKSQGRPPQYDEIALGITQCLKCKTVRAPEGEADDAIAAFIRNELDSLDLAIVVSEDRDLYQLVRDPSVKILTRSWELLDERAVAMKVGVKPEAIVLLKTLMGDRSDNIPKVPQLGKKTAIQLVAGIRTRKQLLKRIKKADWLGERQRTSFKRCKSLLDTNYKLIKLKSRIKSETVKRKPKPKRLKKLLSGIGVWKWSSQELLSNIE